MEDIYISKYRKGDKINRENLQSGQLIVRWRSKDIFKGGLQRVKKYSLMGRYSLYLVLVKANNCCSSHGSESRVTRSKVSGNDNSQFY